MSKNNLNKAKNARADTQARCSTLAILAYFKLFLFIIHSIYTFYNFYQK